MPSGSVNLQFNGVFQYFDANGLFFILLYLVLGLFSFYNGMNAVTYNFFAAPMDHWCRVPQLENLSFFAQKSIAIPFKSEDVYESCLMYNMDYDNFTDRDILTWNRSSTRVNVTMDTVKCMEGWVYDRSRFLSNTVSKYDLVCEQSDLVAMAPSMYNVGLLVGSLGSGIIADRFGRKPPLLVGFLGYFCVSLALPYAPNFTVFVILRFLLSVCNMTSYLCAYVIVMELADPRYSMVYGVFYQVFFSIGYTVLSGVAYLVRDTDTLFLILSLVLAASAPVFWLIPESPRWLITQGRYKEGERILRHIATVNRSSFPEEIKWMKDEKPESRSTGRCADICRSPVLRRELFLVYLNWFTVSFVYYGVSYNAGAFGDVFVNNSLAGLIEIPANFLCWVCLSRGGRKWPNGLSLVATGVFMLACVPVLLTRPDLQGVLTVLSTLGKGAITFAFTTVYVYTAELFPTPVRQLALGSASVVARFGGMAAPHLGKTLQDIWQPMPSMIFGALATATGCLVLLLPETRGCPLPDTTEQAEAMGRRRPHKKSSGCDRRDATYNTGEDNPAYVPSSQVVADNTQQTGL